MKKKLTLRVIAKKDNLDHSSPTIKGYIKLLSLIPQFFEVEYTGDRQNAIDNAILVIENTQKSKVEHYDIIENNQITQ